MVATEEAAYGSRRSQMVELWKSMQRANNKLRYVVFRSLDDWHQIDVDDFLHLLSLNALLHKRMIKASDIIL